MLFKFRNYKYTLLLATAISFCSLTTACKNNDRDNDIKGKLENKENIEIDSTLTTRTDSCMKKMLVYGPSAVYLYDITADKPVYGYNKDSLMHSASCMKLLTGVAGLQLLGTDFKYETKLFINGNIEQQVLNGDITLRTGLDPQFLTQDMNMFSKRLNSMGIKEIKGNVFIDADITEPVKAEEHWYPWDLTFNRYGIFYKGTDRVMRDFKASLLAQGIKFDNQKVQIAKTPEGSRCIYTFYHPVANVIAKMWRNSSNTQSTSLLYTIGRKASPEGNFVDNGAEYLRSFIKEELRLTDGDAIIHDGCGLCTHNKLTPELLVRVLRYGYYHKPIYDMMKQYLPISGKSGSMRTEMTRSKARGKIQAKTGTLSHPYGISTLAGFCTGSNGHQLCFAIMSYDMSVLDGRMIQKKMCEQFIK